jgi:hypothetical protein
VARPDDAGDEDEAAQRAFLPQVPQQRDGGGVDPMKIVRSGETLPRQPFRMRSPGRRADLHRQTGVAGDSEIALIERREHRPCGWVEQRQKRREVGQRQMILVDQAGLDAAIGEHHRRVPHGLDVAWVAHGLPWGAFLAQAAAVGRLVVIARSKATKQSTREPAAQDCFASLAMTTPAAQSSF